MNPVKVFVRGDKNLMFYEPLLRGMIMTKQDRVINYLSRGKTLSQDSAFSMFEVANLRATISDIKPTLRSQGFNVVTSVGRNGETRYGLSSRRSK
jgi:hypothetical protein